MTLSILHVLGALVDLDEFGPYQTSMVILTLVVGISWSQPLQIDNVVSLVSALDSLYID